MSRIRCHREGFALVEILIYLSVLLIVAGGLVTTFLSLDTVLLRNRDDRELTESASQSLERMVRAIRNADAVNAGQSTFGSSPGALALVEGATTTRFFESGGTLRMSLNGVELGPLTSDDVTLDAITFTHYAGTTTDLVRVALTLSKAGLSATTTKTFYTSAVLRGSYE